MYTKHTQKRHYVLPSTKKNHNTNIWNMTLQNTKISINSPNTSTDVYKITKHHSAIMQINNKTKNQNCDKKYTKITKN